MIEGERRHFVTLAFELGTREYVVKATMSDRSTREEKVLLGMDFVNKSGLADHMYYWLERV
jgi:hypothetical protein